MMYKNNDLNYSGHGFIRQRKYAGSVARMRFRVRTILASLFFVAMLGSIIHVINITRPEHTFAVSPANVKNESAGQWITGDANGSHASVKRSTYSVVPAQPASAAAGNAHVQTSDKTNHK